MVAIADQTHLRSNDPTPCAVYTTHDESQAAMSNAENDLAAAPFALYPGMESAQDPSIFSMSVCQSNRDTHGETWHDNWIHAIERRMTLQLQTRGSSHLHK